MTKIKLPCEIVQDLLPNYLDELTSNLSNQAIQEHICECESCRHILKNMQQPDPIIQNDLLNSQIDYLKKERRKIMFWKRVSFLAVLGLLIIGIYIYFDKIGNTILSDHIDCNVSVSNKEITIQGNMPNNGIKISKMSFSENDDGVINISLRSMPGLSKENNHFKESFTAQSPITQVWIDNRILWDHGKSIDSRTSAVYLAKHDSLKDRNYNSDSWIALDMADKLGGVINELNISEKPYGWKMNLKNKVSIEDSDTIKKYMHSYAYVLLATIGDLEYVTYEYTTKDVNEILHITKEDASNFMDQDIKTYAKDPALLQILMEKLDLCERIKD